MPNDATDFPIACLGWGSLIWRPEGLPVASGWFRDGPSVCVEFTRRSSTKLITLVLTEGARPVPALWARLKVSTVCEAREALRLREGIPANKISSVGSWSLGDPEPALIRDLATWASARRLKGVAWTALPPGSRDEPTTPSVAEVIDYLAKLPAKVRKDAEQYVRNAPPQIDTEYRRAIAAKLGWTPIQTVATFASEPLRGQR
jgi:hypothetical protein